MSISATALRRRRHNNPVREARRQAHLSRMSRRVIDYIPTYRQLTNGREVTGQIYTGHVPIYAVRAR
jgi:hypothetical protein